MQALTDSALTAGVIVVFVGVLVLGLALLGVLGFGAVILFHWLADTAFGQCDRCVNEAAQKERKTAQELAEAERIIREHDQAMAQQEAAIRYVMSQKHLEK